MAEDLGCESNFNDLLAILAHHVLHLPLAEPGIVSYHCESGGDLEGTVPKVNDDPGFDESKLERLRSRAEHVIVVMFENRSFDHLLGLLDHPNLDVPAHRTEFFRDYFVTPGSHPNRNTSTGERPPATVTDDAAPMLERDPPHGHLSALDQMRCVDGVLQMDGFVDAYAAKLSGRAPIPTKRWGAITVAGFGAVMLAGAAVAAVAAHVTGSARRWVPPVVAAAIVVGITWRMIRHVPIVSFAIKVLLAAVVGVVVAFGVDGALHSHTLSWRWFAAGSALAVAGGLVAYLKKKPPNAPPAMSEEAAATTAPRIMACVQPDTVKHLSFLAKNYVTCVRWFSSVPGATWPNRNFAHAATSDESTDIEAALYFDRTIFELLDSEQAQLNDHNRTRLPWKVYFHDTPQIVAFPRLWKDKSRWDNWSGPSSLLEAIDNGRLPTYSFVEPCHSSANGSLTNSQHPGNNEAATGDFERADELIRDIYVRLAANPGVFERTVLIITHDEHGGFFDHVAPPPAVPPESGVRKHRARSIFRRLSLLFLDYGTDPFAFDRLGMRVPAVIVSPWVTPGHIDETDYDHTSIVSSLRRLWAPNQPALSDRDSAANDIWNVIDETQSGSPVPTIAAPPDSWAQRESSDRQPLISTEPPIRAVVARAEGLPSLDVGLAFLDAYLAKHLPLPPDLADPTTSGATRLRRLGDSTENGNPSLDEF